MKKLGLLLVLVFTLLAVDSSKAQCNPSPDGLYVCDYDGNIKRYLRFYNDGTVLATDTDNSLEQVLEWFRKEAKAAKYVTFTRGKYVMKKCKIKFEVSNEGGTIYFKGKVNGKTLALEKYNKEKQSSNWTYQFQKLEVK